MKSLRTCFLSGILFMLWNMSVLCQMPQDNWYQVGVWGSNGSGDGQFFVPFSVAVDTNGLIYVTDTGNHRIQVFQLGGTFVRKWGSNGSDDGQFSGPSGIAVGTNGLIYVTDTSNHRIQVFQPDGAFVRKWGSNGSGDGQFSSPNGVAVGGDGLIYVVDMDNHRIQVFQSDGTFVRKWGSHGSGDSQFKTPWGIAVGRDGLVYVSDVWNTRVQVFQSDGTFVRKWGSYLEPRTSGSGFATPAGIAVDMGGLVYVTDTDWQSSDGSRVQLFDSGGTYVKPLGLTGIRGSELSRFSDPRGIAVWTNGLVCVADSGNHRIQIFRRGYRAPATGIPQPQVAVSQRVGVAHVDIDYTVWDSDSTNVQVAALGLSNGVVSLDNVIRLNTLLEGTSNNVGPNIAANVPHRITWDAGADWKVGWGNVKFEILANDGRPMVDFHFITIPSNGPDPELEIERFPMQEADFQHCWCWLVATRDPAIDFRTNEVYGLSGSYSNKLLGRSAGTTADGRAFLFERLNVREATADEVARARAGTTGMTNQWAPRYATDRRAARNEFGFDSAYSQGEGAWYTVPLP